MEEPFRIGCPPVAVNDNFSAQLFQLFARLPHSRDMASQYTGLQAHFMNSKNYK
jgi:hypothetical protein